MKKTDCEHYYPDNGRDHDGCDLAASWSFDCEGCDHYATHKKPRTNADMIRAMSDEELAEFIVEVNHEVFVIFTESIGNVLMTSFGLHIDNLGSATENVFEANREEKKKE